MASKSDLISIELPDASGKTVPFYTYDGFLEENDRTRIRSERRSFEQLKVTGGAICGFVGYYVLPSPCRPPAASPSPSSTSRDARCQSPAFFPELLLDSSALSSSVSMAQADSLPSSATWSSLLREFLSGATFVRLLTPIVPSSSWQTNATTSP